MIKEKKSKNKYWETVRPALKGNGIIFGTIAAFVGIIILMTLSRIFEILLGIAIFVLLVVGGYYIGLEIEGGKKNGNIKKAKVRRNSHKRGHDRNKGSKVAGKEKGKPTEDNR